MPVSKSNEFYMNLGFPQMFTKIEFSANGFSIVPFPSSKSKWLHSTSFLSSTISMDWLLHFTTTKIGLMA